MNALANPEVGKYVNENFCSAFQKVGTFRIVGKNKQGGNVATYFCAPDGRVLHTIAGPVDAATFLREAKWVVSTAQQAIKDAKGDGAKFKTIMRKAHADKLRTEHGLVVEPVLYDPPTAQNANDALTYRDPTGRTLAPKLPAPPVNGPDVKFRDLVEASAEARPGGTDGQRARPHPRSGRPALGAGQPGTRASPARGPLDEPHRDAVRVGVRGHPRRARQHPAGGDRRSVPLAQSEAGEISV